MLSDLNFDPGNENILSQLKLGLNSFQWSIMMRFKYKQVECFIQGTQYLNEGDQSLITRGIFQLFL